MTSEEEDIDEEDELEALKKGKRQEARRSVLKMSV
jgi:hypothetical protein